MLEKGVNINWCMVDGFLFFYIVCEKGYYDIVKFLLCNGGDINLNMKNGRSFFFFVCEKGCDDIV